MSVASPVATRLPPAIVDAIRRRKGRLVLLHEVDHPDGIMRAWSGTGNLSYAGYTWKGIGDLVAIDPIPFSRKTEVRVITVTLGAVKTSQLQFITAKVRGRVAQLSLAALKPAKREVNGDVYTICRGLCDSQDHKIDAQRGATIVLTVNQPIFILDRTPNLAWTPDWLKATYGQDVTGLDDLPGTAARTESWLPAS